MPAPARGRSVPGVVAPEPQSRLLRVLIAGGGVAAVEALLALGELAGRRVDVTMVAPEPDLVYRPLSVVEPFERGRMRRYPLAAIAADTGARLHADALEHVDAGEHRVRLASGGELPYDILLVAVGARPESVLPRAITFTGERDAPGIRELLRNVRRGVIGRVAFAIPAGVSWPFPLYELALSTAIASREPATPDAEITIVTPEPAPLAMFGRNASEAVAHLLAEHGVRVLTARQPRKVAPGRLEVAPGDEVVMADAVVAAPRLRGPAVSGLPFDPNGFVPTDDHGAVAGVEDVFAAGDGTAFPIKQGGLAAQQADATAEAIAARAGAAIDPRPFRPVLRGLLFSVGERRYLRADVSGEAGDSSEASEEALWWPPAKIAARLLSPYLAAVHDLPAEVADPSAVPVELELERSGGLRGGARRRALLVPEPDEFTVVDLGGALPEAPDRKPAS
jgi:sulfide:quinone oxidoreductase